MEAEEREKRLLLHLNSVLEIQKSAGTPAIAAAEKNARHAAARPAAQSPPLPTGHAAADDPELGRLQAEVQRLKVKLAEERMSSRLLVEQRLANGHAGTTAQLTSVKIEEALPDGPSAHHDASLLNAGLQQAADAARGGENGAGGEDQGMAAAGNGTGGCSGRCAGEAGGVESHLPLARPVGVRLSQEEGDRDRPRQGLSPPNKKKGGLAAASSPGQWG